jgi:hypothetical protein
MLNPCNISLCFLIYLCFTKFSRAGELVAFLMYGFSFGGVLGMLFSENDGLPYIYDINYMFHHAIVGVIGPLMLALCGRYDIRNYMSFPLPWMGAVLFSMYERWVLMPASLLTWANLNHGLCGHHSDPLYEHFNMGKWYWLIAEVYLLLASLIIGYGVNYLVISSVFMVVGTKKNDK